MLRRKSRNDLKQLCIHGLKAELANSFPIDPRANNVETFPPKAWGLMRVCGPKPYFVDPRFDLESHQHTQAMQAMQAMQNIVASAL